tara:strand:+ start:6841 stop:7140 length:300 start_codon:yes stop_codon:yes gene_type:complete
MDFPLLFSIFTTVFIAELGDKTQIATFALSGSTNRPYAVFLASSCALIFTSLLGALAGGSISSIVPERFLEATASIIFLYLGVSLLLATLSEQKDLQGS